MSEAATESARAQSHATASVRPPGADAALVLADGSVFWGRGAGAAAMTTGEVCFNTSITGYQEILTDPSYAGQIITFTFPHVGNVGTNAEDIETLTPAALGAVLRADITEPANWRASKHLDAWLKSYNLPAITGVDTRALTHRIREAGFANATLIHTPGGTPDIAAAHAAAKGWPGLEGMDLAKSVTCRQTYKWDEATWTIRGGYGRLARPMRRVVAIDYGAKRNILRCLAQMGCDVTVVPADSDAQSILRHEPDGIFLSNGPGDPAATGKYAVPVIKQLVEKNLPIFGICLGHQMLALALGARTTKMHHGHRGANHPVKDLETGKVEITSQNHGFEVDRASLPNGVIETHRSLFDGCLEGLRVEGKPIFSVQHHPEASPGPQDSHYLFDRFVKMIDETK